MSLFRLFDPRPFVKQWKDWLVAQLPDENWSLLDTIYKYKPSSDVNNWIPPFKSMFLLNFLVKCNELC